MALRLNGSTSGYVELDAPAVAGTTALTLPATSGTVATTAYVDTAEADAIAAGGLQLITTQTFSAVSSVSIDNCFSATYENYLLFVRMDPTDNINIEMRLRASGSDITTAAYNWSRIGQQYNNVANLAAATDATLWQFTSTTSTTRESVSHLNFHSPFATKNTGFTSNMAADHFAGVYNGMFYNTASADGFTIIASSGTLTGNLRVYGYKN
jgi:hypothetical protein